MPEMLAELNAKIPAERRTINLYSDGFNICFDYDSFSNKSIATISHGVSIKMEGLDLTMRLVLHRRRDSFVLMADEQRL